MGILLCTFLLTPVTPSGIQHTHALSVTVTGGAGTAAGIKTAVVSAANAASDAIQAGLMTSLNIKEFTLDGIVAGLLKTALKSITRSILNWINSGFKGSPAFVTDLDGFLLDLADQTAGDFIYGTKLGFLLSLIHI